MKKKNVYILKFIFAITLFTSTLSIGQRVKAPIDIQMRIIPKILSLEKNLAHSDDKFFNISVLYSKEQRNSDQVFTSFTDAVNKFGIPIKNKEAKVLPFDISSKGSFRTPLRGIDISEITKICREEGVLTFTGVEDYLENSVSVVLTLNESKLQIMINPKSSKQEGADFSSRLLRIAKLID